MTKKANAAEQLPVNAERILTYSRKVLTAEIPELMPAFFLAALRLPAGSFRLTGAHEDLAPRR